MRVKSKDSVSIFGFIGKLLKIDLTTKSINYEHINIEDCRKFLGGAGYACSYLYKTIGKDTPPLSEKNIIMIMNGPLCGTSAPSSGRFVICSKSPYTNLWGEANCGGNFAPELKKAGYDGIIITGKAETPIIIKIFNEDIEILSASHLWGKGIKETQNILKKEEPKYKILSIGPAGENLIKFASVNNEGRSAGRTGMGAVFGSKNLKAIIVQGDSSSPKIADPEKFKTTVKKAIKFILNLKTTQALRGFGTSAGVMVAHGLGDLPIKYWSQGEWDEVFNISGEKLKENLLIKTKTCYGCSIGCGRIIEIDGKRSLYAECEGPEYETIAGFGSMILNKDLNSIAIANNLCNDLGMDTISTSGTIALLFDLYNKDIIKKEQIDGLELNWGNSEAMITLIKKIPLREGIGDLLAEGSNAVGQRFHVSKEHIAAINNLEVPYHDLRSCFGLALTYAFSPRGPCHTSGDIFKVARRGNEINFSSLGVEKIDMFSDDITMAKYSVIVQDYRALYSSLVSCFFSNPPPELVADLLKYLLGYEFNIKTLMITGERIFNIKRLFNLKMGLTSANDSIPKILLTPTNEGAAKGKTPDFNKLRRLYYAVRDWNPNTGRPNPEKLKELDLIDY